MRSALTIALITSMLIGAFMLLFGKWILGWFISGTPEEVTLTLQIAYLYLAIMSVCLPILYILYVIRSAIQGNGLYAPAHVLRYRRIYHAYSHRPAASSLCRGNRYFLCGNCRLGGCGYCPRHQLVCHSKEAAKDTGRN